MKRGRPAGQNNGTGEQTKTGELMRRTRAARGISQATLAKAMGVTDTFIARIETGRCGLPFSHIPIVAETLKCPHSLLDKFVVEDFVARWRE